MDGFARAIRRDGSIGIGQAAEQKLAHGGLIVVVRAGGASERVGIAAAQGARREAHGSRRQVHAVENHADVFQDQGVGDRGVFPRDPRDTVRPGSRAPGPCLTLIPAESAASRNRPVEFS